MKVRKKIFNTRISFTIYRAKWMSLYTLPTLEIHLSGFGLEIYFAFLTFSITYARSNFSRLTFCVTLPFSKDESIQRN